MFNYTVFTPQADDKVVSISSTPVLINSLVTINAGTIRMQIRNQDASASMYLMYKTASGVPALADMEKIPAKELETWDLQSNAYAFVYIAGDGAQKACIRQLGRA